MNKKNKEKEDASKYGEFVPSYFGWIGLNEQKKRAEKLEKSTKKTIDNRKKRSIIYL